MKKILILFVTVLCTMSAQAVDDISLSVVKSGISPNWAASVAETTNEVSLNDMGTIEWAFFPEVSTDNYTGVEINFAAAPTDEENRLKLYVYYADGSKEVEDGTAVSGTSVTLNFTAGKLLQKVELSRGFSGSNNPVVKFTMSSAKLKGKTGYAQPPASDYSLPFDKITAGYGNVTYFLSKSKALGIASFHWFDLIDRNTLEWKFSAVKDLLIQ